MKRCCGYRWTLSAKSRGPAELCEIFNMLSFLNRVGSLFHWGASEPQADRTVAFRNSFCKTQGHNVKLWGSELNQIWTRWGIVLLLGRLVSSVSTGQRAAAASPKRLFLLENLLFSPVQRLFGEQTLIPSEHRDTVWTFIRQNCCMPADPGVSFQIHQHTEAVCLKYRWCNILTICSETPDNQRAQGSAWSPDGPEGHEAPVLLQLEGYTIIIHVKIKLLQVKFTEISTTMSQTAQRCYNK